MAAHRAGHSPRSLEHFNTFSLSGLTPGTRYFFRIELLRVMEDLGEGVREEAPVAVVGQDVEPLVFTTATEDGPPRTLYVATDGDNRHHGRTPQQAWRTIHHAADQARPGDTILIGGGDYRIFHDGRRPGIDAPLLTAAAVDDLFVQNCVSLSGWNNFEVGRSTRVVFEHCVFVRADIVALATGGGHDRSEVIVRNSIITDNLARKAVAPLVGHVLLENNLFFLRVPEQERSVFGSGQGTLAQYDRDHQIERPNRVANPQFAVLRDKAQFPSDGFFDDRMLGEFHDFSSLFATEPTVVERQIGLIPADFRKLPED